MQSSYIGITTYHRNSENQYYLPAEYIEAIRRAGAIPLLLAPGDTDANRQLAHIDGLILTGGGDIDPSYYNGDSHHTLYHVDKERDATEFALARYAIQNALPILAICRGIEIINIAEGGNIYQHLPDVFGNAIMHRSKTKQPIPHPVQIEKGSKLAEIVGTESLSVLSWHHQSIQQLGKNLTATAFSPDGVIEAIEKQNHPWLLGVQWHPELSAANEPLQQAIFNAFVTFSHKHKRLSLCN